MSDERRALVAALEEAERRAKGLVFCPIAIAPLHVDEPTIVFATYFVEERDDAPKPASIAGRYWPHDEVADAIGEEWSPACEEMQ